MSALALVPNVGFVQPFSPPPNFFQSKKTIFLWYEKWCFLIEVIYWNLDESTKLGSFVRYQLNLASGHCIVFCEQNAKCASLVALKILNSPNKSFLERRAVFLVQLLRQQSIERRPPDCSNTSSLFFFRTVRRVIPSISRTRQVDSSSLIADHVFAAQGPSN